MRITLLLTITLFSLATIGQTNTNHKKLTVIYYNNQNITLTVNVDTVLKAKQIDLSKTAIDIFYCNEHFHLPYYVPTNSIYKNAAKDKECNMKIYPATVKCYTYDSKKRVIKMTVSGGGTENSFTYKYNDKNEVIEITDYGDDKFTIAYNPDGSIAELKENDLGAEKKLVFIYE